ncbi:MAG: molybdopterin molybdotransferase MoeA [Varibaculum sp.]|nr:molybdopterin molybdotransferase MoeA [Varibaculum sp.]
MRTVSQYLNACLDLVGLQEPLDVTLSEAFGCVLAEDITPPQDRPIVDMSAVDGYAVRSEDVLTAGRIEDVTLSVTADIVAGDSEPVTISAGEAAGVESGAILPIGADAVVRHPDTEKNGDSVVVKRHLAPGENVLAKGSDMRSGEAVLQSGIRIGARQVALLAGIGRARCAVHPKPRVVVLSVGDELVEPGQDAKPGAVFDANGHAISIAAEDAGATVFRVPAISDDRQALIETLEDQMLRADLIVTTGGLSQGSANTVREVLEPLGTVLFDTVQISPGGLYGVGTVGDNIPVFCLPGEPVAAQIGYEIFVRPALRKMAGWRDLYRTALPAAVDKPWRSPQGRREFVRVRLVGSPKTGYHARVLGDPHLPVLSALASANAVAVVPESTTEVNVGDVLQCMMLE